MWVVGVCVWCWERGSLVMTACIFPVHTRQHTSPPPSFTHTQISLLFLVPSQHACLSLHNVSHTTYTPPTSLAPLTCNSLYSKWLMALKDGPSFSKGAPGREGHPKYSRATFVTLGVARYGRPPSFTITLFKP